VGEVGAVLDCPHYHSSARDCRHVLRNGEHSWPPSYGRLLPDKPINRIDLPGIGYLIEGGADRIDRFLAKDSPASLNFRTPRSRAAFIPAGLPFSPIERTELTLLGAGADALDGETGFVPVDVRPDGHDASSFLAVTGDHDFFTAFYDIEQMVEVLPCLDGAEGTYG
jgi:hypothetical protein